MYGSNLKASRNSKTRFVIKNGNTFVVRFISPPTHFILPAYNAVLAVKRN